MSESWAEVATGDGLFRLQATADYGIKAEGGSSILLTGQVHDQPLSVCHL
jgi:hypothetical protein